MQTTSLVITRSGVRTDLADVCGFRFRAPDAPIAPHDLLVQIQKDAERYVSALAYACLLDWEAGTGLLDIQRPTRDLSEVEQCLLREWLIARSWPSWARADVSVRALAGEPDEPIMLAEAARRVGMPLITLAKAAEQGRLPTIQAGDRQLIYLSTIGEARERGLLRGRREAE